MSKRAILCAAFIAALSSSGIAGAKEKKRIITITFDECPQNVKDYYAKVEIWKGPDHIGKPSSVTDISPDPKQKSEQKFAVTTTLKLPVTLGIATGIKDKAPVTEESSKCFVTVLDSGAIQQLECEPSETGVLMRDPDAPYFRIQCKKAKKL